MKYTRKVLAPVIAGSQSFAEVMRKLGIRVTGGSHAHLKRLASKYGLTTSHFLGRGSNCGVCHRGGPTKKTASEILVLRRRTQYKESAFRLRRALLEAGRKEACEECTLSTNWNGKILRLQIDHRNGKNWDNRPENVRFLCPNCHSQTDNFGSKNKS